LHLEEAARAPRKSHAIAFEDAAAEKFAMNEEQISIQFEGPKQGGKVHTMPADARHDFYQGKRRGKVGGEMGADSMRGGGGSAGDPGGARLWWRAAERRA